MPDIVIYSSGFCPYCSWAKKMLDGRQASYSEIRIDQVEGAQQEMLSKSEGQMTVPQIFIGDRHIGGFEQLRSINNDGNLDKLIIDIK